MVDSEKWICLMVNGLFRHGDAKAVDREIASIFGNDLLASKAVCNDSMSGSTGEYYLFLRCANYYDHLERLRKSLAIVSVVPSCDSPHQFDEDEIAAFAGSAAQPKKPRELERGDMVQVTEGYLKNLFGVVEHSEGRGKYKVAFSFHLRKFSDILPVSCLQFVANVLGREGVVAPIPTREVHSVVKRRQLCRKTHRDRQRESKRRR